MRVVSRRPRRRPARKEREFHRPIADLAPWFVPLAIGNRNGKGERLAKMVNRQKMSKRSKKRDTPHPPSTSKAAISLKVCGEGLLCHDVYDKKWT